ITTATDYAQFFPYTGMPTKVTRVFRRASGDVNLTETQTGYCNTIDEDSSGNPLCTTDEPSPGTPALVYPVIVLDKSFLHVGDLTDFTKPDEVVTTTSAFRYDKAGNPTRTTVTIQGAGETYEKKTINTYGEPDSDE